MKKGKTVILTALIVVLTAGLTACGGGKKNGTLNLFIWTEYMPDSVIKDFEKETGIKVQMQTYSNNEEMLAKVQGSNPGAYDIVVPSDYMVENMISQGLLQELDKSQLTNIGNLDPAYLNPSYDPESKYSVPYLGGAGVIVYNKKMVDPGADFTNYDELFKPAYKNSIVVLDDFRSIIGITSLSMGYDFNETDESKLGQIKEKMLTLKPNIKSFDSDSPKTLMITEETSVGLMWSGEAALALGENENLDLAFPSKGMYLFLDNLCITKDAKNKENAYKFIDYVLKAEVNKAISTEFPYLNPNKAGVALMDDTYRSNKAICIPPEEIKKGFYVKNIGKTVDLYSEIWAEFTK
ncbi:spermidine/putrescine ABC transporter substrate-binding protein [Anaerocolumna sp. AGMB13025]|uniref:polyamine ABC transporter substrate-binding protein n=1 Tax=Anaerocolumna sp. AGMB13025 TaxID=3039116 RepID=UPI00241BEFAE|nr:spermidine/putrescine ABC transporter substrate-binding protein [Anaerocolumna sp. AGMB13025]WFR56080.1 spermidine/putrescine ABC transporter substrate-binding protein [Anaerocolumna sp. AGMB13025]